MGLGTGSPGETEGGMERGGLPGWDGSRGEQDESPTGTAGIPDFKGKLTVVADEVVVGKGIGGRGNETEIRNGIVANETGGGSGPRRQPHKGQEKGKNQPAFRRNHAGHWSRQPPKAPSGIPFPSGTWAEKVAEAPQRLRWPP